MHRVAGDGVGILAAAIFSSFFVLDRSGRNRSIFQAPFMRDMAGGSYRRALGGTFVSELLSMNLLMAGMVATVMG
jgi:hypothetical protein